MPEKARRLHSGFRSIFFLSLRSFPCSVSSSCSFFCFPSLQSENNNFGRCFCFDRCFYDIPGISEIERHVHILLKTLSPVLNRDLQTTYVKEGNMACPLTIYVCLLWSPFVWIIASPKNAIDRPQKFIYQHNHKSIYRFVVPSHSIVINRNN